MPLGHRTRLLAPLLGSAVLVSIGILFYQWQNQPQSNPEAQQDEPPVVQQNLTAQGKGSATEESTQILFQPKEGYLYTYSFDRNIEIKSELKNTIPKISYDGELDLGIIKANEKGFEAFITERLSKKTIQNLRGAEVPAPIALRVAVDSKAETVSILSPKALNEGEKQHAAILKDLISCLLFPLHMDTTGIYKAQLTTLASEDGLPRFQKKKISYLPSKTPTPEILSSSHIMQWDPKLRLPHLINGSETSQFRGEKFNLLTQSDYSIRFLKHRKGLGELNERLTQVLQIDTLTLADSGSAKRPLKSTINWPSLHDQLMRLGEMSKHDQLEVFGDLTQLLKDQPKNILDLIGLVQSQDVIRLGAQSQLFKTAVGALVTAGSPDAQAAAIQLYQDSNCPVSGKGTILSAFTTTQASLEPATRNFLTNIMLNDSNPDLSSGAGFALGSSLQQSNGQGTEGSPPAQQSVQQAIQAIQSSWSGALEARNISQESVLLDVMGNSGNSSFMPAIQGAIDNSTDPALTAKAVFALRFMNSTESTQLLVANLANANTNIRLAAASAIALAQGSPAFQTPLRNCAQSDTASQVRTTCQKALDQVQSR